MPPKTRQPGQEAIRKLENANSRKAVQDAMVSAAFALNQEVQPGIFGPDLEKAIRSWMDAARKKATQFGASSFQIGVTVPPPSVNIAITWPIGKGK